ncbi:MAG: hypothetical protein J2P37_31220, partial [Ktedonobacteraceae bacterium]|nr:hypothetical protein [Ktedonobacteraceae bacterium]
MMEQTFPAGSAQRIKIGDVSGNVAVHGWEQQTIKVESERQIGKMKEKGDALILADCHTLEVWAPLETIIEAGDISGSVSVEGIRRLILKDVGSNVAVENIGGPVEVKDIGSNVAVSNVRGPLMVSDIGLDLAISEIQGDVKAADVGGNLAVLNVNGNLALNDVGLDVVLKSVNGEVALSDLGRGCELREVHGNVTVGDIGHNIRATDIEGNLQMGDIGTHAHVEGLRGSLNAGSIGANLHLQSLFSPGSDSRVRVGGNATVVLPESANLSVRASAGGHVIGPGISSFPGSRVNLVFGEGAARLDISVGGNLTLESTDEPRSV